MRWWCLLFLLACKDEPEPEEPEPECCLICSPGTKACGDGCVWIAEGCFPEPPPGCACDFEEAGGPDGFHVY